MKILTTTLSQSKANQIKKYLNRHGVNAWVNFHNNLIYEIMVFENQFDEAKELIER